MTFRIVQISDTHLSGEQPFFVGNFECIARAALAALPDLIVNTGDVSFDGVNKLADLSAAKRLHQVLDRPVLFIPGNHDVGDSREIPDSRETRIDAARRDAYIAVFGQDWWSQDVPGWRLIA